MAYEIDQFGNDQAPPGFMPPQAPMPTIQEDAAKQFARKRLLAALAGGLAKPNVGGGFLGGLTSGFSGAVGSSMAFERQRGQEARDQERAEADQQRLGLERDRLGIERAREQRLSRPEGPSVGAQPWYEALPDTDPRKELYRQDATRGPAGDSSIGFTEWLRMTPEERAKFGQFKQAGQRPPDPKKETRAELRDLNTFSDNFRQDRDVQNFTVVRDNYKRINATSKLGTGQGDLATIFSFMRVLDPESVVRETEFKNAQEAVGRLSMIYNIPSQWVKGNRLTPEGRAGFRAAAKNLYDTQRKTYQTKADLYTRQAKTYGVDPTLIVPDWKDDEQGASDPLGVR